VMREDNGDLEGINSGGSSAARRGEAGRRRRTRGNERNWGFFGSRGAVAGGTGNWLKWLAGRATHQTRGRGTESALVLLGTGRTCMRNGWIPTEMHF
jgi:hypothetical protein